MCNLNQYTIVSGDLTVTYSAPCIIAPTPTPSPSPGTPTPTPTPSATPAFKAWTTQYCSGPCLGGLITCTAASGQTLYTAPGEIITNPTANVYTNSSLTTSYIGYFRYQTHVYYSDGSNVFDEGEIGDPC